MLDGELLGPLSLCRSRLVDPVVVIFEHDRPIFVTTGQKPVVLSLRQRLVEVDDEGRVGADNCFACWMASAVPGVGFGVEDIVVRNGCFRKASQCVKLM